MADANEKFVYVRLNYTGYIPVLNVSGPIRASWVSKEHVKELIRAGYDVEFINPAACPEFAKQIAEYRKYIEAKDYVGAKGVFSTSLDKNPNSAVEQAIAASEGNNVAGATTTAPTSDGSNATGDAVADALASVGEAPLAGQEPVVTDPADGDETNTDGADAGNEFSEDMAGLENLDDTAAGDTEFDPSDDTQPTVTRSNKKHNRR